MMRNLALLRDGLLTLVFLGLVGLAAAKLNDTAGERLTGAARVVDGDTLVLGKVRIRLLGIDAPERAQTCLRAERAWACGLEARAHLARLVGDGDVRCDGRSRDRYGRTLATCTAGATPPANLNARMVADGYALAYGAYEREEAAARAAGRGVWSSVFDRPKDWRARHGGIAEGPHMGLDGAWALWRRIEALWTRP